jgi:sugar phosphate isomerase/epimerase
MTEEEALEALCLDPLALLDVPAEDFVGVAAAAGFRWVSLWVQSPQPDYPARCRVESGAMAQRVGRSLRENGLGVRNLEVFDLAARTDVSLFRPALELGAELGAAGATAIFLQNDDPRRTDKFAELCRLAAEYGLRINAEFISNRSLSSLAETIELLRAADQLNAGIVLDLLHHVRSGGSIGQVRALDPRLVGHAQLCDGAAAIRPEDRAFESGSNRLLPGEGAFPVRAFVDALPPTSLGVEVPARSKVFEGLTPLERAKRLMQATRRVLTASETPTAIGG